MNYRPSKFTAWFAGALLFLGSLYFGERAYKRLFPETRQDQCSFGPVSNEKYRTLLVTLKKAPPPRWEPLGAAQPIEDHIVTKFRELTATTNDIFERIAILHALMRANGARFLRTDPELLDPFNEVTTQQNWRLKRSSVTFIYIINRNDIGYFQVFYPEVLIYVGFIIFVHPAVPREQPNNFVFSARNVGNIQDGYVGEHHSKLGDQCPRVPTQEWWQEFEKKNSQQK